MYSALRDANTQGQLDHSTHSPRQGAGQYDFESTPEDTISNGSTGESSEHQSTVMLSNSIPQAIAPRGALPVRSDRAVRKSKAERRGHTKSRNGCFNCKTRRIKHKYLMHSILGLAASELIATDDSLAEAAIRHRLEAIKAIKRRLLACPNTTTTTTTTTPTIDYAEGNALIAACFALTFQSVFLEDGMAEHMAFIRGIVAVASRMAEAGVGFMFSNLRGRDQEALLRPHVERVVLPRSMAEWRGGAGAALEGLRPLCAGDGLKVRYLGLTVEIARGLCESSPYRAWKAVSDHYAWWMMLPQSEFARIIDPGDQVFMLLASHWIALKQIMSVITEVEKNISPQKEIETYTNRGMGTWLRWLNGQVRAEFAPYNRWPVWVQAQLERDPDFFGSAERGGKQIEPSLAGYAKPVR
ncbi:hypothetical protein VPNG_01139 [Cytospora leucostoma]|uniref:Transcription factor domain-containing protein n=1 Tax=Cytospora leucostoma TaxID=1230097 RepID=A0A423XKG6_9PEZI|nr:hypothetical protein VPNG_01139 [Cytospora leucostoma]